MKIATVAAALVCSSLAACSGYGLRDGATPARVAKPSQEHASVCVFRPHGLGRSVVAAVADNGAIVGATEGSSYFCYQAEPGEHRLRTADATPVVLQAQAGQSYYFVHDLNVGADELVRVNGATADQLTAYCEYRLLGVTPANVRLPEEGAVARAVVPNRRATAVAVAAPPARPATPVATTSAGAGAGQLASTRSAP